LLSVGLSVGLPGCCFGLNNKTQTSGDRVKLLCLVVVVVVVVDALVEVVVMRSVLMAVMLQVPRQSFYTSSMAGVVAAQLGQFGHKPEVLDELLAGDVLSVLLVLPVRHWSHPQVLEQHHVHRQDTELSAST
jgi:hypothetical protein